jgi:hypothetical protein
MWKAIATVSCFGLLGAGATFAFAPDRAEVAPRPHTKPTDEEWLPKEGRDPRTAPRPKTDEAPEEKVDYTTRPTAFPELREPDVYTERDRRERQLMNLCPRLYGFTEIVIEPTDDLRRKLLKARLHQAVAENRRWREYVRIGHWSLGFAFHSPVFRCLADIQSAATELWSGQPKELVPWLEECVVMAKTWELHFLIRVANGMDPPHTLNYVRRHRLKTEAELWKVKNAE